MTYVGTLTRDLDLFERASLLAFEGDYGTKVGCVAAKGSKFLCGAVNTIRNPAMNVPHGEATRHAEYNVLRMLENVDKITLYIARVNSGGSDLPSRPCNKCMRMIKEFGVKEIVYFDRFNKIVKEKI